MRHISDILRKQSKPVWLYTGFEGHGQVSARGPDHRFNFLNFEFQNSNQSDPQTQFAFQNIFHY